MLRRNWVPAFAGTAGANFAVASPPLPRPGGGEAADQQQQADQAGEDRQHADAAHHARLAQLEADPVVAVEVVGAHADDAREVDAAGAAVLDAHHVAAGRGCDRGEPFGGRGDLLELARIGGTDIGERRELAVGGVPEAELLGLDGAAPHARLGLRERHGLRLARGQRQGDLADTVGHGLPLHREIVAAHRKAQRLLLEVGLLHQPMRQAPQQIEMRSAALEAARPQPDVIRQQHRDAALALARELQQRLAVGPLHQGGAAVGAGIDHPEPVAPVRRVGGRALEAARHRMALAEVGQARHEGLLGGVAVGLRGQHRFQGRLPEAGRARIVAPRCHQHGAALAHVAGDVVEIDRLQHALACVAVEDDELELVDLLLEQLARRKGDERELIDRRAVLLLRRAQDGEMHQVRSPAWGSPETSSTRSLSRTPSIDTTARLCTAVSCPSTGAASISTMLGPACATGTSTLTGWPTRTLRFSTVSPSRRIATWALPGGTPSSTTRKVMVCDCPTMPKRGAVISATRRSRSFLWPVIKACSGASKPSAAMSAGTSCTRPSVIMTTPATRSRGTSAKAAPSAVKSRVPSVSPSDSPASTKRTSRPGMCPSRSASSARAACVCCVRSPSSWLGLLSTTTTAIELKGSRSSRVNDGLASASTNKASAAMRTAAPRLRASTSIAASTTVTASAAHTR